MRKILFSLIFIAIVGCGVSMKSVSYFTERAYIGMHIDDFKKLTGKRAKADGKNDVYYAYRIDPDILFEAGQTMFYYFSNEDDKLIEINAGKVMN